MLTFGERLREARRKTGLSQQQAAKRIGTSQSVISQLEGNEYRTSRFMTQLADLYKVNPLWLAEGRGHRDILVVSASVDAESVDLALRYSRADEATQAVVQLLLREPGQARPAWMSPAVEAAVENVQALLKEQLPDDHTGS